MYMCSTSPQLLLNDDQRTSIRTGGVAMVPLSPASCPLLRAEGEDGERHGAPPLPVGEAEGHQVPLLQLRPDTRGVVCRKPLPLANADLFSDLEPLQLWRESP